MRVLKLALFQLTVVLLPLTGRAPADVVITHPYRGITHITRTETSPRNVSMQIVQIDLTAPGIGFKVTPPSGSLDTTRQTTLDFLNQEQAQVAINSHFFSTNTGGEAWVTGLAASNGNVYSPFDAQPQAPGQPDQSYAILAYAPALNIDAANHATIVHRDTAYADNKHVLEPVALYNAVSGSAQIVTNGVKTIPSYTPTGPLNQLNGYSNANSWYGLPRARTSIGLTQDNKTLVLFTVDQAGTSGGMTPGEVADVLMSDYNVYNALNLDGGGSTALALRDPITGLGSVVNVSSDPGRAAGSNLAVFAEPVPEPSTVVLVFSAAGAGLLFVGLRRRSFTPCFAWNHVGNMKERNKNMIRSHNLVTVILATAAVFAAGRFASAEIIRAMPYVQDFSSGADDFQPAYAGGSSTATWSAGGGAYNATINRVSGASFYTWNSVNLGNLGPATPNSNFTVSSLLKDISIGDTSVNTTAGLRFLADTINSNTNAYVVDLNIGANPGRVRLVRWTGGTAKVFPDSAQANQPLISNFSRGDPYLFQVFGSYDAAGLLDLAVQVTNMNHPGDLVGYGLPLTPITHGGVNGEYGSSPPTGHYFGYYASSSNGANTTIQVTADDFSVVPESSALALAVAAAFAASVCFRRRRAS